MIGGVGSSTSVCPTPMTCFNQWRYVTSIYGADGKVTTLLPSGYQGSSFDGPTVYGSRVGVWANQQDANTNYVNEDLFSYQNGVLTKVDVAALAKPGYGAPHVMPDGRAAYNYTPSGASAMQLHLFSGNELQAKYTFAPGVNMTRDANGNIVGLMDLDMAAALNNARPVVAQTTIDTNATGMYSRAAYATLKSYVIQPDSVAVAMPTKMVYSDGVYDARATRVLDVTADNKTVLGIATSDDPTQTGARFRSFRYKIGTDQLDMISRGAINNDTKYNTASLIATAANADATVVAGAAMLFSNVPVYFGSSSGGGVSTATFSALDLDKDNYKTASAGSVGGGLLQSRAWIFDEVKGTRFAEDVLRSNGYDIPNGATVASISAMTPDGSALTGQIVRDQTNNLAREGFLANGLAQHRWLGAGGYAPLQTVAAGQTKRVGILGGDASGVMTVEAGGVLKIGETLDSASTDANARTIWGGSLTGAGAAVFSGQKWIVTSANSISGGFTVVKGDVEMRGSSFSGPVAIGSGGMISGTGAFGALGGTGMIFLRNARDRITVGAGDASSIYDGLLSGAGTLEKVGAGAFTFTKEASGGAGLVKAGVFNLLGDWDGPMRVEGGVLAGSGKANDVTVVGGAHVVGLGQTMTVRGDYTLGARATFAPALDASGASGKVSVQGKIALDGATLDARQATGDFAGRKYAYTLIENKGGQAVSGAFGSVLWDLPYLRPSVTTASDVVLTLERQTLLPTNATPVEASLAASLDKLAQSADPATRAIISELAYTTSSAELRGRLAQISGAADARGATQSALASVAKVGDLVSDVMINPAGATWGGAAPAYAQPRAYLPVMADLPSAKAIQSAVAAPAFAPTWGVWGKAIGAYTRVGAGAGGVGSTSRFGGAAFGVDAQALPSLRVGAAGGWRGERMSARSGSETTQSGGFGAIYAQADFARSYVNGAVVLGQSDVKSVRHIAFGSIVTSPTGKYDARDVQARVETGHSFALGDALSAQPYLGLRYISLRQGAYQETNSPLALSARARTTQAWDALAGVRFSTQATLSSIPVAAQLRLGVVQALGATRGKAIMALAGVSPYVVTSQVRDRTTATLGAGLGFNVAAGVQAFVDYDLQASRRVVSHQGQAGMRVKF